MILTSIITTVIVNIQSGGFLGSDIIFHSNMARAYTKGEFAFNSEYAISINGGPYPPLFHLLLAAAILLGKWFYAGLVYFLQYAMYPLVVSATIYLAYKKMNIRAAAWTGILMLFSIALFDRASQATPQGLDMILFPLAVLFFLDGKSWRYITAMTLMIYNHGIWSYLHYGALVIMSIIKRKSLKDHIIVFLLTLPLFVATVYYLPGYFGTHGSFASDQEKVAAQSLWYVGKYMGAVILLLAAAYILYVAYKLLKERRFPYRPSMLEQTSFLWILCLTPLFFMIKDRFASYVVPPLAIILAGWIIRTVRSRRVYIPLIAISTIVAMLFSLFAWILYFKIKTQVFV